MKTVIYSRVSTQAQDFKRQIEELKNYASANSWAVEAIFSEKVSGAKKNNERYELMEMIDYVKTHKVDKVMIWEPSRLGRNTLDVLKTIELFNDLHVSLYIKNYNLETLNADGKPNTMAQFLVTLLAEVARMERTTIKERMDSGYEQFRLHGGKVGRKVGYTKSSEMYKEEYSDIIRLLKRGLSLRNVAKLTSHSLNTVSKCKRLFC